MSLELTKGNKKELTDCYRRTMLAMHHVDVTVFLRADKQNVVSISPKNVWALASSWITYLLPCTRGG